MRSVLVLFMSIIAVIGLVAAGPNAVIQPGDPDDITLNGTNNYTVNVTFDGSASTGTITSYSWNVVDDAQTASGVETNLTFDRDSSASNTVRLTVTNGSSHENGSDIDEVSQVVHDAPNASISASSTSVTAGDSVDFTSFTDNSFDGPVTRQWLIDGTNTSGQANFTHTFSNSGTYSVKLKVNDSIDNSHMTSALSIDVSSSSSSSDGGGSDGGGGGSVVTTTPASDTAEKAITSQKQVSGLSQAPGIQGNTKLQNAIEKVLGTAELAQPAREQLEQMSQAIAEDTSVSRSGEVDNGTTDVTTNISYSGNRSVEHFMFHDTVPKDFASNASAISVTVTNAQAQVVEEDPSFLITDTTAEPGETYSVSYSRDTESVENASALDAMLAEFNASVYGNVSEAKAPAEEEQEVTEEGGQQQESDATGQQPGKQQSNNYLPIALGVLAAILVIGGITYGVIRTYYPHLIWDMKHDESEDDIIEGLHELEEELDEYLEEETTGTKSSSSSQSNSKANKGSKKKTSSQKTSESSQSSSRKGKSQFNSTGSSTKKGKSSKGSSRSSSSSKGKDNS